MANKSWSNEDLAFMQLALHEARQAGIDGEVPVGALVVIGKDVVAGGRNRTIADSDPSGHAEVVALRAAGNALSNHRLPDATLYVTLEPCVMCVGAIVQARIARVVFAAYDDKGGALGGALDLSNSRVMNHSFEVNGGVMAEESSLLLRDFFRSRR